MKEKDASSRGWGHDAHGRVSKAPAAARGGSEVGNERKADVRGVQEGGSRAEGEHAIKGSQRGTNSVGPGGMRDAVEELHRQHPHHHSSGGIHGTKDHIRHDPLHGMRPVGRER